MTNSDRRPEYVDPWAEPAIRSQSTAPQWAHSAQDLVGLALAEHGAADVAGGPGQGSGDQRCLGAVRLSVTSLAEAEVEIGLLLLCRAHDRKSRDLRLSLGCHGRPRSDQIDAPISGEATTIALRHRVKVPARSKGCVVASVWAEGGCADEGHGTAVSLAARLDALPEGYGIVGAESLYLPDMCWRGPERTVLVPPPPTVDFQRQALPDPPVC